MTYFVVDGEDYSKFVNQIKVNYEVKYNAQTNAAGNIVIDYINTKRSVEVGFIPMSEEDMSALLGSSIGAFNVEIEFRNPETLSLETINCIIPSSEVEYYTIRENNISLKGCNMTFIEL